MGAREVVDAVRLCVAESHITTMVHSSYMTITSSPANAPAESSDVSVTPEARTLLAAPFIGYLLYFVGIGQIAGGIVHYPIDPAYFTMMAVIGVFVFLAGTLLNEVILPKTRPSGRKIARLVGAAVVLSIGVGGVSGGVQHFLQFPQRSTVLIAAGLVLAFIGFIWKGSFGVRQSLIVGVSVAAIAALTFAALQPLSASIPEGGGHDHSHAHGAAANDARPQPLA